MVMMVTVSYRISDYHISLTLMPSSSHHAHSASTICVVCTQADELPIAEAFASQQQLPLRQQKDNSFDLQLCYLDTHIELYSSALNTSIHVDFCSGKLAHRRQFGGGRGQAIAKAIGLKQGKSPHVLDATAGLASDAFTLATLGCKVTLLERSAILYALVNDAIQHAQNETSLATLFQNSGFQIHCADSIEYMQQLNPDQQSDVIYLDPMYPEKKKSAQVKKSMQILKMLHGADDNGAQLLECSLDHAIKRVVVKRPIHAPPVSNQKPSACIKSKNTRYDIYALQKM